MTHVEYVEYGLNLFGYFMYYHTETCCDSVHFLVYCLKNRSNFDKSIELNTCKIQILHHIDATIMEEDMLVAV